MVVSAYLRRWRSSSIIFLRWVTGIPLVTHTYIKPSSNQRSTTSRVASAAGRLRSSPVLGSCESRTVHYQGSVVRFYNNLQDRRDCQNTQESYKTSYVVGWVVGCKNR